MAIIACTILRSGQAMSMLSAGFVLILAVGGWSDFSRVSGDDGTADCGGFMLHGYAVTLLCPVSWCYLKDLSDNLPLC